MRVEQFKVGEDRNFSYLVISDDEAVVIDPFENIEIYEEKAKELEAQIIGVLNTHTHSDHAAGNKPFREKGIKRFTGDITLGEETIKEIETPGHTNDSVCYYADKKLFTGDTLFVGKIGHARDEEQARKQYESLHQLIEKLPEETTVYPGHDFATMPTSTLKEEKENNPFLLQESFKDFWNLKNHWKEYKQEHNIQ